jgi:hypothetical protein
MTFKHQIAARLINHDQITRAEFPFQQTDRQRILNEAL